MARFSALERATYLSGGDAVIDGLLLDGGLNTAAQVRSAFHTANARQIEADRHYPADSTADCYMSQTGSDVNNWFTIGHR